MQPQRVFSVKTCLGANWDTWVCVLKGQQVVYMLTLQSSQYNHTSWSLSEQRWCRPALRSFTVLRSMSKSFLKIDFFVTGGKLWSSKKQHCPVFYYIVFLQWPSAWKQLSSWAILALTSRSSLMRSICKRKEEEKKESVIREIKSYVYSVTPHILWSACRMWCAWRKTNSMSQYKAVFVSAAFTGIEEANVSLENECAAQNFFFHMIYFSYVGLQEYFVLSAGSLSARCRDMSGTNISLAHKQVCSLQLYSQPWVVTLHFLCLLSSSHCFRHYNTVF